MAEVTARCPPEARGCLHKDFFQHIRSNHNDLDTKLRDTDVCLLSEGWFDLGLEGWVDFNRKKGRRRTLLAWAKVWKLEGTVGGLGSVKRSQTGCRFNEARPQVQLSPVPRRWTSSPLVLFFWICGHPCPPPLPSAAPLTWDRDVPGQSPVGSDFFPVHTCGRPCPNQLCTVRVNSSWFWRTRRARSPFRVGRTLLFESGELMVMRL